MGLAVVSCDLAYPEIVVVNRTDPQILLRRVSFNGCLWDETLGYGSATSPRQCLPGEGYVHFQRFDVRRFCQKAAKDGTIDGICCSDDSAQDCGPDKIRGSALIHEEPVWFNYRTVRVLSADYYDHHIVEITMGDMEQDFSVPGPYGH